MSAAVGGGGVGWSLTARLESRSKTLKQDLRSVQVEPVFLLNLDITSVCRCTLESGFQFGSYTEPFLNELVVTCPYKNTLRERFGFLTPFTVTSFLLHWVPRTNGRHDAGKQRRWR